MIPPIIGISGKAGAGKDLVASLLGAEIRQSQILRFAAPLKTAAAAILNVPVEYFEDASFKKMLLPEQLQVVHSLKTLDENTKPMWTDKKTTHDYRWFIQVLGTEVGRSIHPDLWVWSFFNTLDALPPSPLTLIPDVRFQNEAAAIVARGGIVIRVENPNLPKTQYLYSTPHKSEVDLDHYSFDAILHNDGSKADLARHVHEFYWNLETQAPCKR